VSEAAAAGSEEGRRPDEVQRTQQKKKNEQHRVQNRSKTYKNRQNMKRDCHFFAEFSISEQHPNG
jgi:hypothetical protein